jgi:hypothetical protein
MICGRWLHFLSKGSRAMNFYGPWLGFNLGSDGKHDNHWTTEADMLSTNSM